MKTTNVDEWLKNGLHLPEVMRDFHDQKAIFKAMHEILVERPGDFKRPSWIEGHVYVVDMFLWFMARRGYTLQRTRRKGNFRDLTADVKAATTERDMKMAKALGMTHNAK